MSCPHISHCTTTVHPKERKTLGTNRKILLPVWLNLINSCKVKSNKMKWEKKFNLSLFHHLPVSFSILSIVCWVRFHLSISMKCVVNLIHVREAKPWERKCASNTHAPNGAGSQQQWDTRLRTVATVGPVWLLPMDRWGKQWSLDYTVSRRATNAALAMCSVLCADLFPKEQVPMTHFPVNIIYFLQRWCFHPAEIEQKKVSALLITSLCSAF